MHTGSLHTSFVLQCVPILREARTAEVPKAAELKSGVKA